MTSRELYTSLGYTCRNLSAPNADVIADYLKDCSISDKYECYKIREETDLFALKGSDDTLMWILRRFAKENVE